ncbi:MAG: putative MFS multidrug transporter [Aureobasidium pullulans]|nr:MAG: putative MFS multidrug transporter [Aureobasidium pullulans]
MANDADTAPRGVASAVVLPDATPSSPRLSPARSPTPPGARAGLKRRQSSASHDSPKRQRLSHSPERSSKEDHAPSARERRPAKPIDEKKRTQRLFGGLLGGLGQTRPANSAVAKRRAEQEERRRQKEQELSERQTERIELLSIARKKEQRRVDEASMRIKHENIKAMTNFLTTSTEPKLYFRPWELLPEQESQINRQREDVDVQIDQELDDFDQVRQSWQNEDTNGHAHQPDAASTRHMQDTSNGTNHASEPMSESAPAHEQTPAVEPISEFATEAALVKVEEQESQNQAAGEADRHRKDSIDDTGDVVVEADEDTVIY